MILNAIGGLIYAAVIIIMFAASFWPDSRCQKPSLAQILEANEREHREKLNKQLNREARIRYNADRAAQGLPPRLKREET